MDNIHFGYVGKQLPDWRDEPILEDTGNDEDWKIEAEVLAVIGFDPDTDPVFNDLEDVVNGWEEVERAPAGTKGGGQWISSEFTKAELELEEDIKRAKKNPDYSGYTPEDMINDYTGNDYNKINSGLRHGTYVNPKIIAGIDHYLGSRGRFEGTSYRAITFFSENAGEEFLENAIKEKVFFDKAYLSSSTDKKWTFDTGPGKRSLHKSNFGGVYYTIEGKSGRTIQSSMNEDEILFPRRTKFKQKITSTRREGNKIFIDILLQEIGDKVKNKVINGWEEVPRAPAGSGNGGQWIGTGMITDENGIPVKLYHGTTKGITAEDLKQSQLGGDYGEGIYLTTDRREAEQRNSENIIEANVISKKHLVVGSSEYFESETYKKLQTRYGFIIPRHEIGRAAKEDGYTSIEVERPEGKWIIVFDGAKIKSPKKDVVNFSEVVPRVPAGEAGGGQWTSGNRVTTVKQAQKAIDKMIDSGEITEDEHMAIDEYTGSDYYEMNRSLRDGEDPLLIDRLEVAKKHMDSFLEKAPKFVGETYRGIEFTSLASYNQFASRIKEGMIVADKAYLSTTSSEDVSNKFAKLSYQVKITIKGKSGVYLGTLSSEDEDEVLFRRNSKFKVSKLSEQYYEHDTKNNKYKKVDKSKATNITMILELEEL